MKIKKVLLVLTVLLVPFFSNADIFTDGSIPTLPPSLETGYCITAKAGLIFYNGCGESEQDATLAACSGLADILGTSPTTETHLHEEYSSKYCINNGGLYAEMYHDKTAWYLSNPSTVYGPNPYKLTFTYVNDLVSNISPNCPPTNNPTYTYSIDLDSDGLTDLCADPKTIQLLDTCNINDSPNVTVTAQDACYTKADGSQCNVAAVDVGGGNQVYMGSEGNCYTDPLPDVTNNPDLGGVPVGPDCVPSGSLLACPEDPTNVCVDSGSSFGGASTNNCQAGCGYINDSFVCIDSDTDSDGLPDYNDPDIDGDGVSNGNDIDADGDGKDDPIYSNVGGGGVGGSALDLKPVVDELKKLNEQFKVTPVNDFNSGGELDALNSDYNAEIKGFKDKTAAQLGFQDTLTLSNSSSLTNSIPVEQCQNYSIPVGFFGEFSLDTCSLSSKVQPLLTWFFGLLTAWYIFFTINRTLSEGF